MRKIVPDLFLLGKNVLDLVAVLVDVELGDTPDWNLQKSLNILQSNISAKFGAERFEAIQHRSLHTLVGLFVLDAFVYALFNEDTVKRAGMEERIQLVETYLKFTLREEEKTIHITLQYLRDGHCPRSTAIKNDRT